jgi:hypothetical protein
MIGYLYTIANLIFDEYKGNDYIREQIDKRIYFLGYIILTKNRP